MSRAGSNSGARKRPSRLQQRLSDAAACVERTVDRVVPNANARLHYAVDRALPAVHHALHSAIDLVLPAAEPYRPTQPLAPRLKAPSASKHRPAPASAARDVLAFTNAARVARGLRPLRLSGSLCAVAKAHTEDQAFRRRGISHRGTDGTALAARLRRAGYHYRYASENVARGQSDAAHVFRSWMGSDGHRRNILSPHVTEMGLYVLTGCDGTLYWTQLFGDKA